MKMIFIRQFLVMTKLSFYGLALQMLFSVMLMAKEGHSQHQKLEEVIISIDLKNTRLDKAFAQIEQATDFNFLYNTGVIDKGARVNVKTQNESLISLLKKISEGTGLKFMRINENIYVSKKEVDAKPSSILVVEAIDDVVVKGKVTSSEDHQPLPGVSILIKGTSLGTTTDAKGEYTLSVPEDAILIYSFIGYTPQEIAVNNQSVIDISMQPDATELEEVVVTAMNIKKSKKVLGYSVSEIGGDKLIKARETNIANTLTGKIAGVNVVKPVSGSMGSSRVVIRGNGSLSSNQPLYVIDGIPLNNGSSGQPHDIYGGSDGGDGISSINPDDIESMSVLKGATAAALYGSMASNGAIIITTKQGKARKGIGVEVNSTFTFEKPIIFTEDDYQYEYGQGILGQKPQTKEQALELGVMNWGPKLDGSPVVQFDGVERPYAPVKDNMKEFYSGAYTATNSLAFNGGNETSNFRFSISDLRNEDLFPNSELKRNTFTLNYGHEVTKKLSLRLRTSYIRERVKNRPNVNDFDANGNFTPYMLPTNYDINNLEQRVDEDGKEYLFSKDIYFANPYFIAYEYRKREKKDRIIGSIEARYQFSDALYAQVRGGGDFYHKKSSSVRPTGSGPIPDGTMGEGYNYSGVFNYEALLGFQKELNSNWTVDAFVGGNIMKEQSESVSASGRGFIVPGFYALGNTKSSSKGHNLSERQINSVFGSVEVGYKSFLYLTFTGRSDWFSTLNPEDNNIFYPSVGASFILSDAVELPSWISYMKFRGSWANAGGGDISPYARHLTFGFNDTHLGRPIGYVSSGTIPNSNLRPFINTTYEAGLDARFLNNRLGIDFTVYKRKATDDILSSLVSVTSGYSSVKVNVGGVENQGVELMLTGTPIKTDKFAWDITLNGAYNQSKVISLSDGLEEMQVSISRPGYWGDPGVPGFVFHEVGQPFGVIKGFPYKRDENGNIVHDANGLPVQGELTKLGEGVSPLTIGLSNTFTYQGFYLNFLFDSKFGGDIYSGTNVYAYMFGLHKNTLNGREGGLVSPGVNEQGQPNTVNVSAQDYYGYIGDNITEEFVYDASFIKLRELSIGYSVPRSFLGRTPFQALSISLVGRNLWTLLSHVPIVDPESTYSAGNAQGFEMFALPATRSFGVNLNVKL
ncbi:SusC/RagA family TonB-linked outer membrane protein [Rapidithrix thailandica]|uniref:SusC/RagA family TonB-linked outer membrane protein n=1 Tax=Rapidithrix thailandica TaxID=413964 RepID=A0AAW9S9R2_9BACT